MQNIDAVIRKLLTPTKVKRFVFFLVFDVIFFVIALAFALNLRFEFEVPSYYITNALLWAPFILIIKIGFLNIFRVYSFNWSFVGINELYSLLKASACSFLVLISIDIFLQHNFKLYSLPKSVIIIDTIITVALLMFLRILKRIYKEVMFADMSKGTKTIIIGAGLAGERIVREVFRNKSLGINPVCFVDDNKHKLGTLIQGVKVVGTIEDIPRLVKGYRLTSAIIAIANISHKRIQEIYTILKEAGVDNVKIVPSINKLPDNTVNIKDLRDLNLEDLMARREVTVLEEAISDFVSGRKILVTGAAGSIGSEIVRQLIKFKPDTIFALEIDESELHDLEYEVRSIGLNNLKFVPLLCDVRNTSKVAHLFDLHKPDIVFHAAAYKHVPLIEAYPDEAITTNIFGTENLILNASRTGVKVFINISTDKAVNPTSLMGATKRMAEMICQRENMRSDMKIVSVRFGNVLGSRGSVLTIFQNQIKKGGPVTVTHPDMIRFFMSIPEAVLLVFQAASMGSGGEIFILDMGEPKNILDLAQKLITLQGYEPYKDIAIEFSGLRPGEKLYEELVARGEEIRNTNHPKIFRLEEQQSGSHKGLEEVLERLQSSVNKQDYGEINAVIRSFISFHNS